MGEISVEVECTSESAFLRMEQSLFALEGQDPTLNALFFVDEEKMLLFARGFKLAGDAAIQRARDSEMEANFVLYPAMFAYRHFLELIMKHVIKLICRYFDEDVRVPTRGRAAHRLLHLWQTLRPYMQRFFGSDPDLTRQLNAAEDRIRELDNIDPGSLSFRYPGQTAVAPSRTRKRGVNLGHVQAVMDDMYGFLEGAASAVKDALEAEDHAKYG